MKKMLARLLARGLAHFIPVTRAEGAQTGTVSLEALPPARHQPPISAPRPPALSARRTFDSPLPRAPASDDPDDEMRGDSLEAQARVRERARCAAIVTSADGLKRPEIAYALAFQTRSSVAEALQVLRGLRDGEFGHLTSSPAQQPSRFRLGARVH